MMRPIKYLWLFPIVTVMSGCAGFSQAHYDELMNQSSDVQQLKANDQKQDKQIQEIEKTLEKLKVSLQSEIKNSGVTVEKPTATSVKVSLPHTILFGSGSAQVDKQGKEILSKISSSLQEAPKDAPIRIVGYTDSMPVGEKLRARYKDNWALSSARAAAVARVLIWGEGIDKNRIRVEGRADTNPVATNSTAEGRQKNRRIEIFIGESS